MNDVRRTIPDPDALLAAIYARCTNRDSHLHGPAHWRCVAWTGLELLAAEPTADPAVLLLFAMFHDSMRLNDGHDPQHGPRAAAFALSLRDRHFRLTDGRMKWLSRAIRVHTTGRFAGNTSIACCWDADRLNLWRVGVRPDPAFLSTATARTAGAIQRAHGMGGQHHPWSEIVEQYAALGPADTAITHES